MPPLVSLPEPVSYRKRRLLSGTARAGHRQLLGSEQRARSSTSSSRRGNSLATEEGWSSLGAALLAFAAKAHLRGASSVGKGRAHARGAWGPQAVAVTFPRLLG